MSSDDVRARRAERVREQKLKDMPKVVAKNAAIGVAIVVAVGGLGTLIWWTTQGQPDHVHWHAGWELYAWDEEEGSYRHFEYTNGGYDPGSGSALATPMRNHLHTTGAPGSDNVVHLESRPPPFELDRFFDGLGIDMKRTSLTMDDLHGGDRFANNATHSWRLFVQPADGDWEENGRFNDYTMQDGDRLLVTFGDPDAMDGPGGELERQLASVDHAVPGFSPEGRGPDTVSRNGPADGGDDNATADVGRD